MSTLRAIVIGAGNMGQNHARVLSGMEGVELVGIADTDEKKLIELRERYPMIGLSSDYHALTAGLSLHIAVVATPNHLHVDIAAQCLRAGIHVLVEKPVATSLEAARALKADEARGIEQHGPHAARVAVGYIERFNPAIIELKHQIAVGNVGTIYEVRCERYSPWPYRMKDAGVALDLATHDVDLLRYIVGKEVKSVVSHAFARGKSEDLVSALFEFEGGTLGAIHTNWLTPRKIRRVSVTGSSGYFEANLITQELFFHENGSGSENELSALHGVTEGNVTGFFIQRQEPLVLELEDFVQSVREHRPARTTLADATATLASTLLLQK